MSFYVSGFSVLVVFAGGACLKKLWSIFLFSSAFMPLSSVQSDDVLDMKPVVLHCESDTRIFVGPDKHYPEYIAEVVPQSYSIAELTARQYIVSDNKLLSRILIKQFSDVRVTSTHLTILGDNWNLAITPTFTRASLYSSNPYINEVPMFCLSKD